MGRLAVKIKKGTIFWGLGVRKMWYSIFGGKSFRQKVGVPIVKSYLPSTLTYDLPTYYPMTTYLPNSNLSLTIELRVRNDEFDFTTDDGD